MTETEWRLVRIDDRRCALILDKRVRVVRWAFIAASPRAFNENAWTWIVYTIKP